MGALVAWGYPSVEATGSRAGGEPEAFASPLTWGAKGKRLGREAQNGGRGKESVRGKKAYASSGAEKGGKGAKLHACL